MTWKICMIQRRFDYGQSRAFSDSIIGIGIAWKRRSSNRMECLV